MAGRVRKRCDDCNPRQRTKAVPVSCEACGGTVLQKPGRGRRERYCSDTCRTAKKRERRSSSPFFCQRCGLKSFGKEPRMFCSDNCRYENRLIVKPCDHCKAEFKQRQRTSRFCSNRCSALATYHLRLPKKTVTRQCLCCQRPFRKKNSGRNAGKYCSRDCAFEARRLRLPHAMYNNRRSVTVDVQLSIWFTNWGNDSQAPLSGGLHRGGHKGRCERYGCHYEPFPSRRILERDGWRCQICQCELLPKWTTTNGTSPHPRSPTIDHIIPLSIGPSGPGHTPTNVQAACWRCNSKKSDSFALP